jgi:hypothetical protein
MVARSLPNANYTGFWALSTTANGMKPNLRILARPSCVAFFKPDFAPHFFSALNNLLVFSRFLRRKPQNRPEFFITPLLDTPFTAVVNLSNYGRIYFRSHIAPAPTSQRLVAFDRAPPARNNPLTAE